MLTTCQIPAPLSLPTPSLKLPLVPLGAIIGTGDGIPGGLTPP